MERRFKLRGGELLALCAFAGILVFFSAPKAFGAEDLNEKAAPPINENTAASLEMITERMKALSGSLAAIPEPPRLNQVIQIPEGAGPNEDFGTSDTEKETEK